MGPAKVPKDFVSRQHRKLGPGQRVSRACLFCRQRKSRCDLDSGGNPGTPPCQRCVREGRECILGTSNRGGRRIRKNKGVANPTSQDGEASAQRTPENQPSISDYPEHDNDSSSFSAPGYPIADLYVNHVGKPTEPVTTDVNNQDREQHHEDDGDNESAASSDSAIDPGVPRNPSDAWQCLTGIAKRGEETDEFHLSAETVTQQRPLDAYAQDGIVGVPSKTPVAAGIGAYQLVKNGSLDPELIFNLIKRYQLHFHPYQPLVPRRYFEREMLDAFASNEKHLLTAVLTIASKDLLEMPHIHECCSKYMHELVASIAAGTECDVEAVESLILLAEWEPQGLRRNIERVGRGEEDRAAWMHVGLALRSGYFMGLDRTSFRGDPTSEDFDARKRLAWTSCYITDRLISVRIGRAFWSRGPGPMTGFVSQDFPSLQPVTEGDEDYAKIIQATLELTQLYSNVHEILYSGMRASNQMMLMGDYIKYADDFRTAIHRWNQTWGGLKCSSNIKLTLQMSYEYLRLYTNAFAFQAAISQAIVRNPKTADQHNQKEHLRATFSNVASMSDARFIYESLDAARSYLDMLVSLVNPEEHLRFMPLRYYLYSIYAAVFLYKARSFGVMSPKEEIEVRELVSRTTETLHRASAGPDDMGSRYARLLELLWKPRSSGSVASSESRRRNELSIASLANSNNNTTMSPISGAGGVSGVGGGTPHQHQQHHHRHQQTAHQNQQSTHFDPANDFSWLDLGAVGDYVSGDQMTAGILGFDGALQDGMYSTDQHQPPQQQQMWQTPFWTGDSMSTSLFF
ncbi:hypothetical protein TMatcc_006326 [Talaromyces marneffei ATCC 18224]|uniref:C6 transcription factor, putative n=1 Tax=Talaromyces marneffei (strain ATCC 18224 / CBS 334.59 / QM 7333) TaxID=441960 RepID=B6QBH2_TALMQ|nr:uncharacterized protein EYB26_002722 [Talaromyces marneffei]EEA25448.1 C6 transcription factor, putative [Talaromyces marneffei ATCC 18224]KAE8554172.1 hypothetical protein EYB25_002710 [Talaromyces marneffei]QGA15066.1 hypothetical protein EYB26_002722 [Talaromyces marneffei]